MGLNPGSARAWHTSSSFPMWGQSRSQMKPVLPPGSRLWETVAPAPTPSSQPESRPPLGASLLGGQGPEAGPGPSTQPDSGRCSLKVYSIKTTEKTVSGASSKWEGQPFWEENILGPCGAESVKNPASGTWLVVTSVSEDVCGPVAPWNSSSSFSLGFQAWGPGGVSHRSLPPGQGFRPQAARSSLHPPTSRCCCCRPSSHQGDGVGGAGCQAAHVLPALHEEVPAQREGLRPGWRLPLHRPFWNQGLTPGIRPSELTHKTAVLGLSDHQEISDL